MESVIALLLMLLLVINIPLASVLYRGISITTNSKCAEDIKGVKKNHTMLKIMSILNVVITIILLILTSM